MDDLRLFQYTGKPCPRCGRPGGGEASSALCGCLWPFPTWTIAPLLRKLENLEINQLLELLAALEHEQWITWSRNVAESESLSFARIKRWQQRWSPYAELAEEHKEIDRIWAQKVIDSLMNIPELITDE